MLMSTDKNNQKSPLGSNCRLHVLLTVGFHAVLLTEGLHVVFSCTNFSARSLSYKFMEYMGQYGKSHHSISRVILGHNGIMPQTPERSRRMTLNNFPLLWI